MSTHDKNVELIVEFYELIKPDIDNFIDLIPLIVSSNDNDVRLLKMSRDMVKSLKKDFTKSETLGELNRTLDVNAIIEDMDEIRNFMSDSYGSLSATIKEIGEEFGVDDEIY